MMSNSCSDKKLVRVKYSTPGTYFDAPTPTFERGGCLFIQDPECREYDWLVVYDSFLPGGRHGAFREWERLACPREHTILITAEPPTIRTYARCFTEQFAYVLTTHLPQYLRHPGRRYGEGSLRWVADYPLDEVFAQYGEGQKASVIQGGGIPSAFPSLEYPKTKGLSTVCSVKQQKHTLHYKRYQLTQFLQSRMPEMDWYGFGVKPLKHKYEALTDYRYHVAVENYIGDYHWTDKISDPILGLCLTFYAGDPRLGEIIPPESFIPIPLDDHEAAYHIIREAMLHHEYEKRLPAIREARRLIVKQYNLYNRVAALVHEVEQTETQAPPAEPFVLKGRHLLRLNPVNALSEGWEIVRNKCLLRRDRAHSRNA